MKTEHQQIANQVGERLRDAFAHTRTADELIDFADCLHNIVEDRMQQRAKLRGWDVDGDLLPPAVTDAPTNTPPAGIDAPPPKKHKGSKL